MKLYKACSVVKGKYKSLAVAEVTEEKWRSVIYELFTANLYKGNRGYFLMRNARTLMEKIKKFIAYRFLIRTYAIGKWTKPRVGKLMVFGSTGDAFSFANTMEDAFDTKVFECVSNGTPEQVDYLPNIDNGLIFVKQYWALYKTAKRCGKYVSVGPHFDFPASYFTKTMRTLGSTYLVDSVMLTKEVTV